MGPLNLVQLTALMDRTSGRAEISVGLIDGPRSPCAFGTCHRDARRQTSGNMDVFDLSSRAQSTWIRLRSRAGTETEANAEVPELCTAAAARCWHLRHAAKTKPEPGGSDSPATTLEYEQTYPWVLSLNEPDQDHQRLALAQRLELRSDGAVEGEFLQD
jgi:hypothetical protein